MRIELTISLSNVNTEIGSAATTARDLAWVKANTKDSVSNLGALYSRSYYQKNNAGNCNNGNCWNCYGNCGNIQCNCGGGNNCYNINCTNCDTKNYIQAVCNCACTYNCAACYNCFSYNCNCDCACDCNCACK